MTVTIQAILDFPSGSSIGLRAYKDSAPDTQHGSDIILAQDDTRDNLYEASGVSLDALTQYTVDIYTASDDENIDAGGYFGASPLYVGADEGTFFLGTNARVVTSSGTVTISAANYGQDGETLRMKRGSKETLSFELTSPVSMSDVLFGIRDNSRSLLKVEGTIVDPLNLTFDISASDAMNLYSGTHNYDVFEVEGYNSTTGAYTDARLLATAPVVIDPLYLRLENE